MIVAGSPALDYTDPMSFLQESNYRLKKVRLRARARARLLKRSLRDLRSQPSTELGLLSPEERAILLEEATSQLRELVQINSSAGEVQGVGLVQSFLFTELTHLGFEVEFIPNKQFLSGDMLLATKPSKAHTPYVTLIAHADTVLPPSEEPFVVSEDGRYAVGSGVIDNKGGLIVALLGLRLFLKRVPSPSFSLRWAISPNEEEGSQGFIDFYRELAQDTFMALGFEPSLDDGSIIESRRGNRWYDIRVRGKEAHAGRSQGQHINAAHELSRKIYHLSRLNDDKHNIAVNVGHIEGGANRFNIICGEARAKLDVRFSDFEGRDQVTKAIEKILNKNFYSTKDHSQWAQTVYQIVDDCPPFEVNKNSRPYLKAMTGFIEQVEGLKVGTQRAGGAGDVNHLSKPKTIVIDGLGARGGQMHTDGEFIYLPSLVSRAEALALYLEYVHRSGVKPQT